MPLESWQLSPEANAAECADLYPDLTPKSLAALAQTDIPVLPSRSACEQSGKISKQVFLTRYFHLQATRSSNPSCSFPKAVPHAELGSRQQRNSSPQGRRAGAGGEGDLEQVKQLAVSVAELALMTASTVRVHDAALLRTWMLPASTRYAEAGIHAGKECHAAVKAAGRAHGLGSPHLHVWASLIMTAKNDSSLQQGEKEAITAHANSVTDPKDLELSATSARPTTRNGYAYSSR